MWRRWVILGRDASYARMMADRIECKGRPYAVALSYSFLIRLISNYIHLFRELARYKVNLLLSPSFAQTGPQLSN